MEHVPPPPNVPPGAPGAPNGPYVPLGHPGGTLPPFMPPSPAPAYPPYAAEGQAVAAYPPYAAEGQAVAAYPPYAAEGQPVAAPSQHAIVGQPGAAHPPYAAEGQPGAAYPPYAAEGQPGAAYPSYAAEGQPGAAPLQPAIEGQPGAAYPPYASEGPPDPALLADVMPTARPGLKAFILRPGLKALALRYGKVLWWFHSFYALGLGISIIIFAQKGFAHARWLSVSLAGAWIVLILFFRLFGSGKGRALEGRSAKLRFFVMTYVLKNLYQGMLFFLLPFYWRAATVDTANQWFVLVLGICAALSTLDVVFDQVLMRWKVAASLFYFVTLFACLNLVIPALLPNMRSLVSMTAAAAISALAFWVMHVPVRLLARPSVVAGLAVWTVGAVLGAYVARSIVPPVAMYVEYGAVGPDLLSDGRLSIEASKLHHSLIHELYAVTDVMVPGGKGDRLVHVWIHEGKEVDRETDVDVTAEAPSGMVRLRSQLDPDALRDDPVGSWTVDVMTEDGQLVGRASFEITK